ncbi:MAG: DnaJ domain-containing protein [Cyanobacteria bacterium CRU_2_1]|nr:DnaJ domain-containing protein [Cyanobacteria bacterium CRU_2_1]
MSQISFSPEWTEQFSDPYAVLGLSVTVDDRRVLKRYHAVVKRLHPDSYTIADATARAFASQILTRLVNPAYQKLKQEKNRADIIATLRIRAQLLSRKEALIPKSEVALHLLKVPTQDLDIVYEQAIDRLAQSQFQPLTQFESVTQQLAELNLVYLHLKMGEPIIREKRTGIVAATQTKPPQFTPPPIETAQLAVNYAQRHYQRAQEYAKKANWTQVVAELRDAIRLEPTQGEYHSLLATAYLMQNLVGMAKVHFRQALKFNPQDPLALRYAAKLKLTIESPASKAPPAKSPSAKGSGGGIFSSLFAKRK